MRPYLHEAVTSLARTLPRRTHFRGDMHNRTSAAALHEPATALDGQRPHYGETQGIFRVERREHWRLPSCRRKNLPQLLHTTRHPRHAHNLELQISSGGAQTCPIDKCVSKADYVWRVTCMSAGHRRLAEEGQR